MDNNAIIPSTKLENDFYEWYDRHETKLQEVKANHYDLVFIGDSITHFFAGHPGFADKGDAVWQEFYGSRAALNLGFGWDRTQNVLWRLQHGEFAGQTPRLVVLNIGTNNLTGTENARSNTPAEIAEGIAAICRTIWEKSPRTHILLMGIFPRGAANDPLRTVLKELNALLAAYAAQDDRLDFLDIGQRFLDERGEFRPGMMPDQCHPSAAAYRIWADAIEPVVQRYLTTTSNY